VKILCLIGCHDWRNGPGSPCTVCGEHDTLFCGCSDCRERRGQYDDSDATPAPTVSIGSRTLPQPVSDLALVLIIVAGLLVGLMGHATNLEVQRADALRPKTVASRSHP